MEKYLGNKRVLLDDIYSFSKINCPDAKSMFDIFTGTTNVARMFKKNGFITYANDANRFSNILGKTYLELSYYPQFEGLNKIKTVSSDFHLEKRLIADLSKNRVVCDDEKVNLIKAETAEAIKVFNFLNSLNEKLPEVKYIFYDYYSQFGDKSDFTSVRGTSGKRNYFSKENAIKLDNILHYLKVWKKEKSINDSEYYFILTAVIEEVVLIANVSGTFHDFNRKKLWPNSLQSLYLKIPAVDVSTGPSGFSYCGDSQHIASNNSVNVDLLYIDPPYNFRQYTAYYHLLNFIASFATIDNLDEYLSDLSFVRGQNASDDFTSDFCFKNKFINALDAMIADVKPKYVIMSYYGGRNHWNHWSKGDIEEDNGFKVINDYFKLEKYCEHSYSSVIKLRQNYQSRGGEQKKVIDEYLFFAKLKS